MNTLSNNDLIQAARELGCDVAAIRAVDEVESNGRGFVNGTIVLRFETAKFRDYTGITVVGSDVAAYSKAAALNAQAAMLSTSWGRYQIMGFNYKVCGYASVSAFVSAMKTGEQAQLKAFIAFVKANQIDDDLRRHDWAGFAYRYNGAGYRGRSDTMADDYDLKLAAAFIKYSKQTLPADTIPTQTTRIDGSTILALLALCLLGAAAYYAFNGRWSAIWTYTKLRLQQLIPAPVRN